VPALNRLRVKGRSVVQAMPITPLKRSLRSALRPAYARTPPLEVIGFRLAEK
jgi:hypothetical protein